MKIAIIGAGVVGVSTACYLAQKGLPVSVFDPEPPGTGGASRGNAAQIFPAIIHPLASPAVLRGSIRLLTDPNSPLSIPPGDLLRLTPWLVGFVRACRPGPYQNGTKALSNLNRNAYAAFASLLERAGRGGLLKKSGAIQLYESEKTLAAGLEFWRQVPQSHAGTVALLEEEELRAIEPAIGPSIRGGVVIPGTGVLRDPVAAVEAFAGYAQSLGARFLQERVEMVTCDGVQVELKLPGARQARFDRIVICAGVWSRKLCAGLSDPQCLEAERGYNLTLPVDTPVINHALIFAERGVVATQLSGGLRFGGWDELGGTRAPPNPRIFRKMEKLASELLPGHDWSTARQWMGHRPSLPDTLPVIGQSKRHKNVFYAFGHGHLGMTQGPVTGQAIAALITGEEPKIDLSPFAPR